MIVDRINTYLTVNNLDLNENTAYQVGMLANWSFKRQFMEDTQYSNKISLSQAGKCPRQLAYKYHEYEKNGKKIDSRAKIIFWQGDLVEIMMMKLAELAGCNIMATGLNQLHISIPFKMDIPFENEPEIIEIFGHPDGILLADTTYLVECKSMSSYSFANFEKSQIDESYLIQIMMYLYALKLKKCVMVAMNKDNGIMCEQIVNMDEDLLKKGLANVKTVLNCKKEELPEGWYIPDAKGFYPWQCLYCAYWKTCKPNAEQVLVGKSYKLKERKADESKS